MNTIDKNKKQAVIAGAGPAGLTGAYELLKHTDIHPVVFEESGDIGGISKTVRYQGNRMDIGGLLQEPTSYRMVGRNHAVTRRPLSR